MIANERMAAQLLSGRPARRPEEVVGHLLAVQGQDPRGFRLAIRARSTGLHVSDVDRALTEERSLVVTWLNRGTLHLVRTEDYWWLRTLTTPRLVAGNALRLGQEGVSADAADRGVAVIERALAADGPLSRSQLRERIAAAGVRVEGQALIHLLVRATLRDLTVRGPMVGGEHCYAQVPDWLGAAPPPVDRDTALSELARRYLRGHGPATDRDLAKWAGLPLGDARRGLAGVASGLTELPDGLVDLAGRDRGGPAPPLRLLGAFDPLLLGWASRDIFLAPRSEGRSGLGPADVVVAVNGLFRPFALIDGRAAVLWRLVQGRVRLDPTVELSATDSVALAAEAADVERFLTPS